MGFNTVAMLLNDYFTDLEKSPHAVTWALCNPPHSPDERAIEMWINYVSSIAKEHNEGTPIRRYGGGLRVLPTFHADSYKFLFAGENTLEELRVHKFGKAALDYTPIPGGLQKLELKPKDVKTVTLILPDWWRH